VKAGTVAERRANSGRAVGMEIRFRTIQAPARQAPEASTACARRDLPATRWWFRRIRFPSRTRGLFYGMVVSRTG
jgi:hypothetical protein